MDPNQVCKFLTFGIKRKAPSFKEKEKSAISGSEIRVRVLPDKFPPVARVDSQKDPQKRSKKNTAGEVSYKFNEFELLTGSYLSIKPISTKQQKLHTNKSDSSYEGRIHDEQIRSLRKVNKIFTWGTNIPDPFINFSDLKFVNRLEENLKNFTEPTPIQMQAIPISLQRRDLLASAQTGSGKTLAFAIPVILDAIKASESGEHGISAIILTPTKVLAKQIFDNFVLFCNGLTAKPTMLRKGSFDDKCNILITTPNRLIFAMDQPKTQTDNKNWSRRPVDVSLIKKLKWLIFDECDRLFDNTEGDSSFHQQVKKIIHFCTKNCPEVCRAFYSATFSYTVEEWCRENLTNLAVVCIGARNSANSSVKQELVFAGWEQAKISVLRDLFRRNFEPPSIVFVQSKDRAKQLYMELKENFKKIPIGLASGELSDKECDAVIDQFRAGSVWVLICTELIGRGLDFPNVQLVINFDLPTSIVSYIHRVGRTGRAGKPGRAITLFTSADFDIIRPIATVIHQSGFPVPEYLLKLNKVSKNQREKLKKKPPKRKNFVHKWNKHIKQNLRTNVGIVKHGKNHLAKSKRKRGKKKDIQNYSKQEIAEPAKNLPENNSFAGQEISGDNIEDDWKNIKKNCYNEKKKHFE